MRDQLLAWARSYPKHPSGKAQALKNSPLRALVCHALPRAIKSAVPRAAGLNVRGGIGEGRWTHTPWVALLDPELGAEVEDGVYVVYLLSLGCERLYLTIAQGCTELYDSLGKRPAALELRRRAELMRPILAGHGAHLRPIAMELSSHGWQDSKSWRGPLYEASLVVGIEYSTTVLPAEAELVEHLEEAIALYRLVAPIAKWQADSEVLREARAERGPCTFEEAKRYGQHRRIERKRGHSSKVKKELGHLCMGCRRDLNDGYGTRGRQVIEAHHLRPLSSLAEGETVEYQLKDFAVLCPNCHRVIHRMKNPSDLAALQQLIASQLRAS